MSLQYISLYDLFKCTELKTKERTLPKSIAIALKAILMKRSWSHDSEQDLEKASWYLANLVRKKYDKRKHRNDMGLFAEYHKEQLIQKRIPTKEYRSALDHIAIKWELKEQKETSKYEQCDRVDNTRTSHLCIS